MELGLQILVLLHQIHFSSVLSSSKLMFLETEKLNLLANGNSHGFGEGNEVVTRPNYQGLEVTTDGCPIKKSVCSSVCPLKFTFPETNSFKHLKIGHLKRKLSYSNHPLLGAFAVSFREGHTSPLEVSYFPGRHLFGVARWVFEWLSPQVLRKMNFLKRPVTASHHPSLFFPGKLVYSRVVVFWKRVHYWNVEISFMLLFDNTTK